VQLVRGRHDARRRCLRRALLPGHQLRHERLGRSLQVFLVRAADGGDGGCGAGVRVRALRVRRAPRGVPEVHESRLPSSRLARCSGGAAATRPRRPRSCVSHDASAARQTAAQKPRRLERCVSLGNFTSRFVELVFQWKCLAPPPRAGKPLNAPLGGWALAGAHAAAARCGAASSALWRQQHTGSLCAALHSRRWAAFAARSARRRVAIGRSSAAARCGGASSALWRQQHTGSLCATLHSRRWAFAARSARRRLAIGRSSAHAAELAVPRQRGRETVDRKHTHPVLGHTRHTRASLETRRLALGRLGSLGALALEAVALLLG